MNLKSTLLSRALQWVRPISRVDIPQMHFLTWPLPSPEPCVLGGMPPTLGIRSWVISKVAVAAFDSPQKSSAIPNSSLYWVPEHKFFCILHCQFDCWVWSLALRRPNLSLDLCL